MTFFNRAHDLRFRFHVTSQHHLSLYYTAGLHAIPHVGNNVTIFPVTSSIMSNNTLIPITSLSPQNTPPPGHSIRAIVTLSWPYSSSTRQCALLLADPDFRLRNRKGQVRVRFAGASAEAVAKARIGIGDEVVLDLDGGKWEEDTEALRTPGKSVDGELYFRAKLGLKIVREGREDVVEIDGVASPEKMSPKEKEIGTMETPAANRDVARLRNGYGSVRGGLSMFTYASPAFAKRVRLSGEDLGPYDVLAMDGIVEDEGEHGKRTSFGSKINWRHVQKTPSPTKETFERMEASPTRQQGQQVSLDQDDEPRMLPPPLPRLDVSASNAQPVADVELTEGPSTPKLLPVKSPTLPLPSPFPTDAGKLPSSVPEVTPQVQALSPTRQNHDDTQVPPTATEESEPYAEVTPQPTAVVELLSDTEEDADDEEMLEVEPDIPFQQQEVLRDAQDDDFDQLISYDDHAESGLPHDVMMNDMPNQGFLPLELPQEIPPALLSKEPKTPTRFAFNHASIEFGLDGVRSAPGSAKVTPQSEKERVMTKTFRSLFGFKDTPEPEQPMPKASFAEEQQTKTQTTIEPQHSPTPVGGLSEIALERLAASGIYPDVVRSESAEQGPAHTVEDYTKDELPGLSDEVEEDVTVDAGGLPPVTARSTAVEIVELDSDCEDETDTQMHHIPAPNETASNADQDDFEVEVGDSQDDSQAHQVPVPLLDTHSEMDSGLEQFANQFKPEVADATADDHQVPQPQGTSTMTAIEIDLSSPVDASPLSPHYPILATQNTDDLDVPQPQSISYPTLPFTPSNSQPLTDMLSQDVMDGLSRETLSSVLPPTPQLTQAGSSTKVLDVEEEELSVSQQPDAETLSGGEGVSEPRFPLADNETTFQSPNAELPDTEVTTEEAEMSITQPSAVGAVQEANKLAQAAGQSGVTYTQLEREVNDEELSHDKSMDTNTALEHQSTEPEHPRLQPKTPARKSISSRLSNVPDVISAWFSPKRSYGIVQQNGQQHATHDHQTQDEATSPHHLNGKSPLKRIHTNGISTALGYFTPLSRLEEALNPASQQSYGAQTVDVFAVVTDFTKEPVRAKGGPRDYYTIFRIADSSIPATSSVRVEVYRPWRATLPVAAVGDIVLLRAFVVKSRKRLPYLLSTDASGWCVWRYQDAKAGEENAKKSAWTRKAGVQVDGAVREEVKGPPVELGEEEREHAKRLRQWWQTLSPQVADSQQDDTMDADDGVVPNGHGSHAVAAKL